MSCEQRPGRIAALAAKVGSGIGALANKRGFYAGLAVAGTGLIGAGLTSLVRRKSKPMINSQPSPKRSQVISLRDIPKLPPRTKIKPIPRRQLPKDPCANCQTSAQDKPGPWYTIKNRAYCQDCAPQAAQEAQVDLVLADSSSNSTRDDSLSRSPRTRPVWSMDRSPTASLEPLSPEQRVETKLVASRIRLRLGEGRDGPLWAVAENGYVALRPNGWDTGLAITPALKKNAGGGMQEDPEKWWITHISSGKGISGPYETPQAAKGLADVLAQLDWTREEDEIGVGDLRRVQVTASAYKRAMSEAKAAGGYRPSPQSTPFARSAPEDLTGQLRADGYGGVARVLEDNGQTLFIVDSLGTRYEVNRNETRAADEQDFEMSRVAMSFDPAKAPQERCAGCRRSAEDTGAGEMWYKMGWQAHCESCARRYAAEEAYIMEDDVGDLMLDG